MSKTNNNYNLPWILTVIFLSSIYIFRVNIYGSYILFGIAMLMLIASAVQNNGKLYLNFGTYHVIVLTFSVYCLLSSLWAIRASDSLTKGITIFEIFVCMAIFYAHYASRTDGFEQLIEAIQWSGYVVGIYTLINYGSQTLSMALLNATRLDSEFNNVNEIAALCAVSIVLTLYRWLNREFKIYMLLSIPLILILIACSSKRAFTIFIVGIILILFRNGIKGQRHTILKRIIFVIIMVSSIYFLLSKGMLSGVNERVEYFIHYLLGNGSTDHSTQLRGEFIQYGIQIFIKNPLVGIGIGCAHLLVQQKFGLDVYLHNNFVELLAGGGIIGFAIFYSFYYEIIKCLVRKEIQNDSKRLFIFILIMLLITDIASASYYSKETYFFLMVLFVCIDNSRIRDFEGDIE